MNSSIRIVLDQLDGVRESSGGWMARCPAHEDRSPSLSVGEGTDGRVLLNCFAGCTAEEVVAAAGLQLGDLFPEELSGDGPRGDGAVGRAPRPQEPRRTGMKLLKQNEEPAKPSWNPFKDGEQVAVYHYTDSRGAVVFEVVRFEVKEDHPAHPDKTFIQRSYLPDHPDSGRRGCPEGFVWGSKKHDVEPVLYRLPDVLEAARDGRTVFVCEGEKDVHTIEALGLTGTTAPGGAKKWEARFAGTLAGAHVVVLPDNDAAGEQHAEAVARGCYGKAASVRILRLPDLPPKGDVTDWTRAGHTAEDLKQAARETLLYEPTTTDDDVENDDVEADEPPADESDEPPADPLMLSEATHIPDEVFELLPPMLREAAGLFEQRHERDVFLTGALPVLAGCLPSAKGYYGHNSEALAPNLYACIIAGAAGGKGPLRWAERLASGVDQHLREESERARELWEDEKTLADQEDRAMEQGKPPKQSLLLPANTSAAAFHGALAARGGRAVVVESEIDTLLNALGQEWGKFDDTLRKAFHHERISYLRKTEEAEIRDAALSLVLSGTPGQFRGLIQSTENGLYSRTAVYYFEAPPVWIDQRPTKAARQKAERFEAMAGRVLDLYRALSGREAPLWVHLEEGHWDQHRDTFAPILRRAHTEGVGHLDDVVKRAGLIAFRIAMTCAVWRRFEAGASIAGAKTITATDEDVEAGLWLACTYADHALRFARMLAGGEAKPDPQLARIGRLLPRLPDAFTNEEVYAAAESDGVDVSQRQLRSDLTAAAERGLIRPMKRSHWIKAGAE